MYIAYDATRLKYYLDYLIEHCILAVAFFLPLSLNATSLFLAVGAVSWLAKMLVSRRVAFKRTPFDEVIAIFVILAAASIWESPDRNFSFYNFYHLMGRYILIYYLVINNICSTVQLKRIIYMLLGSAVVVTIYGFYQYIYKVDISAFEWVDGEQFPDLKVRVFSTLQNPNLLAGFLVTVMSMAVGLACKVRQSKTKLLLFGLVAMFGTCLVLTYSRGAWLSVIAVIGTYGLIYNRRILWLLLIIPVIVMYAHDVLERLLSIINPTDTSSTLRLALWESTWSMIVDKPLFGIGWGAYWLVYPEYDFFVQNTGTKIFHAHNMYLNIAAEIGIPGLLAFLAIMYGHARTALQIFNNTTDYWMAGLMLGIVSAIVGLAVSGFTDYVMFNIQMSMLFWLLNALVVVARQELCRCNCNFFDRITTKFH